MNNKQIKRKIKSEFSNEVPDVLNKILSNCKEREVVSMKKEKNIFKPAFAFALVLILALIASFVSFGKYKEFKVDSIIELDVNPSIEIKINDKKKIVEANALNVDGKKILKDMNLKNSDLNVAVNAIIGSMYKNGYLTAEKNSILVSVNNKSKAKRDALEKELTDEINNMMKSYSVESAILTQEYTNDTKSENLSKENGISKGKAAFINKILESNLTNKNGEKYTFEDLSNLSINELNVILNSKNKQVSNVTSTGSASTKSYIGYDKARRVALEDAKVTNPNNFEIELDYEFGTMVYEIDFDSNGNEYEYQINASTGQIINKNTEKDDDYVTPSSRSNITSRDSTNVRSNLNATSTNTTNNYITRAKAKSIALNNAGVSEGSIRDLSIELDRENGKMIYEVSFESGNRDYEYDIDAVSGSIIHKNVETDD